MNAKGQEQGHRTAHAFYSVPARRLPSCLDPLNRRLGCKFSHLHGWQDYYGENYCLNIDPEQRKPGVVGFLKNWTGLYHNLRIVHLYAACCREWVWGIGVPPWREDKDKVTLIRHICHTQGYI